MVIVDEDIIPGLQHLQRLDVQRIADGVRELGGLRVTQGEAHGVFAVFPAHLQGTAHGGKCHKVAVGFQFGEDDVACGKGRMPAQVHFDVGREPAQLVLAPGFDRISGLRNAVVCGNAQQLVVVQPLRQRHDARDVAQEAFRYEGVYAEDGEVGLGFHRSILSGAPHEHARQHHRSGNHHQQESVGQDVPGL